MDKETQMTPNGHCQKCSIEWQRQQQLLRQQQSQGQQCPEPQAQDNCQERQYQHQQCPNEGQQYQEQQAHHNPQIPQCPCHAQQNQQYSEQQYNEQQCQQQRNRSCNCQECGQQDDQFKNNRVPDPLPDFSTNFVYDNGHYFPIPKPMRRSFAINKQTGGRIASVIQTGDGNFAVYYRER